MTNTDKQCPSCGGFCGKVCERENVVEPYNGWILRNVYFEDGEPLMHSEPENTQAQELADYRLKLLTKMPSEWVGLTDEEIRDLWSWSMTAGAERTANTQQHAFARAIEAKLKEKNCG